MGCVAWVRLRALAGVHIESSYHFNLCFTMDILKGSIDWMISKIAVLMTRCE